MVARGSRAVPGGPDLLPARQRQRVHRPDRRQSRQVPSSPIV